MSIKIRGLEKLQKKLIDNADPSKVRQLVKKHGAQMQNKTQRLAPVDSGTLKRSIELEISLSGLQATVKPTVHYAPYVEYGTRKMNAHPFLKPAHDMQKEAFKKDIALFLKK